MRQLFFILIFTYANLFSQPKLDSLVSIGNEQSFQFNFSDANNTFETIINMFPESSQGYYFKSRNYLWFYLANRDSLSKNLFFKFHKIALQKAKNEYNSNKENAKLAFNLGNVYFLNSIYNSSEQNSTDAFWSTKSAVGYFEDAIESDENYFEPRLPLGTIQYALSFVPGFLAWAISIVGLDGNKTEGLNNISLALENCKNYKTEAAYHLGKIYTEYNAQYIKAEKLLSNIVNKYPNNELFLYQYAILKIDKRELQNALKILDKIIFGITKPNFIQTYALSFFLKGEVLFKLNRFNESISEYEKFIQNTLSPDYTGIANLKIALAFEMLNEKHMAQKHYILARNGNQNIAEDISATKLSKDYFDKIFSENDKIIIRANNYLESGKYDETIYLLKDLDKRIMEDESIFTSDLIIVESLQNLNKFDKAIEILKKYDENSLINNYKDASKFYYLTALQEFHYKRYSASQDNLDLAFDIIQESNNKLHRLLINLLQKLDEINNNFQNNNNN